MNYQGANNMHIVTAPEPIRWSDSRYSIFLAGAIDMGAAVDWQANVIKMCDGLPVVLYNPRRTEFTPDTLDEQITWELEALDRADTVLMWLPGSAKAPVSMFEAGLYWRSGKLCIGADPAFYRRRNLELTGKRYGVRVYETLEEVVKHTLLLGAITL
jgi:hypothetical protein